jgi:hypothetical protein
LVTVKVDEDVAEPPSVETLTGPLFAPFGTTAVTVVSETPLKFAFDPLKVTEVTPTKPLPVIITVVPAGPMFGERPTIAGAAMTLKFEDVVTVPPGVATVIGPVVAPIGTTAVI